MGGPVASEAIPCGSPDDQVRALALAILEKSGYVVLVARDGDDALRCSAMHPTPIHLPLPAS